ncbi:MAG TPA: hypothetical protein PLO37_25325 [Candidatus Hydrogenedentes bacterium]|nr:hypothetical protein [Candidatus Hydrogenedentota bacterium]HPG70180.1 hypothetical protein [Candidatus Hydrogenedentota bacterium]
MMGVVDPARYERHRAAKAASANDLWLPMLLFGAMGAIAWAIRGTGGWNGVDGTIVPGLTWGVLWYYLCRRKGIDARGIALWLGLGIALGGELGYGQYVSWIRGQFHVGDEIVPIAPWVGYVWFAICGIGWGAPGGIALGWALGDRASARRWAARIFVPAATALGGWLLVKACPWIFFPHHDLGLYAGALDSHLERTVYTNTQNFVVVAWWMGAMIVAAFQRDRSTLTAGAIIGGGFGPGFLLSALWCLGYSHAPQYIDWWKMWELNAGLFLGILYAATLHWAIGRVDAAHRPDGTPVTPPEPRRRLSEWSATIASALGVWLILVFTFIEGFVLTGVLLGLFYAVALAAAMGKADGDPDGLFDRRSDVSVVFSVFLLVFVTCRGATSTLGGLLGLYDVNAIDQYSWPASRVVLFAPMAVVITVATMRALWRIIQPQPAARHELETGRLAARVTDLMTGMAAVGAITIWPEKIGALYALFLCLALFAFSRVNLALDAIDRTPPAEEVPCHASH